MTHPLDWLTTPCARIDADSAEAARAHQNTLTKPPGSLGRLEEIAVQFAGWQHCVKPELNRVAIRVFAGDHGLCKQNISAFPQQVTAQMIDNFVAGGAAINVLSRFCHADFDILNLGTVAQPALLAADKNLHLGAGTADASEQPAMTQEQLIAALNAGRDQVDALTDCQLFIGGEMGIGNTSSASLIYALLAERPAAEFAGPGTGLSIAGVTHKETVLNRVQDKYQVQVRTSESPALAALQLCGGFEIAAICGAYLRCAQRGIPVLVDGFITSAAFMVAQSLQPQLQDWSLFAHCSAEPAHRNVLEQLNIQPLLDLEMRLGEGSGAALAVPLLQQALALHGQMATFTGAGVDDRL
ncbi:nicotinate-nucleotide--dimethylbenzimidazole phosphoribosyltransferase [Teredinibacter turnerae]|uniref:nicotinate-nucleotide--dimethylbenzimidazole phosphoribosyltransferase n=1 Tax=Teredinibacter turnerae TaxID=2426 RepID=UPI00036C9C4B|nr:nicotinate-nucleotide--dimethylbenzimidazole phosphoribosyltransferase [Teredinibacter turnerae]